MQYNPFSSALKTIAGLPKSALSSYLATSKAKLVSEKIGVKYREMKIADLKSKISQTDRSTKLKSWQCHFSAGWRSLQVAGAEGASRGRSERSNSNQLEV